MATDGWAIKHKGSFGFILTNTDGTTLLSCYGQPAGHDPLPFWSEACVFLAAIRIIFLIVEYYNESINNFVAITSKIHLYIDSLSMIKKLNSMNKYPTAHLRCAMDLEWDILQVLHRLMKQMKERPVLEWVASHQDIDPMIDITKLSKETQLNIKADELAAKDLQQLHTKPKVPLDPLSEVLLHHDG